MCLLNKSKLELVVVRNEESVSEIYPVISGFTFGEGESFHFLGAGVKCLKDRLSSSIVAGCLGDRLVY